MGSHNDGFGSGIICFQSCGKKISGDGGQDTEKIPRAIHRRVDLDSSRLLLLDALTSRLCKIFYVIALNLFTTILLCHLLLSLLSLRFTYRLVHIAVSCLPFFINFN